MLLRQLRFRLFGMRHVARRPEFLADYQYYPADSGLTPEFITRPRRGKLVVTPETPVASMGSCFAREIKSWLVKNGFSYVQTETNRWSVHASCAWERVYTIANALQMIEDTAQGALRPERIVEERGAYLDVFRNKVAYGSRSAAETDIANHLAASRAAFERCRVFILTIGQNELWRSRARGFYFATRPPRSVLDADGAEPVQLSYEENVRLLERFYERLKELNPEASLLLTISPVPSLATFFDENVVTRSVWNKSILRAAVGSFVDRRPPDVFYFPSYEIVQTWRGNPFLADNRHVKPRVVDEIMQAFRAAYVVRDGRG